MKYNILILLAVCGWVYNAHGQQTNYGNYQFPEAHALHFTNDDVGKTVAVFEIQKNKRRLSFIASCPAKGIFINSEYRKNGTVSGYGIRQINDSNRTLRDCSYKNGKFQSSREYSYLDQTKPVRYHYFYKDSIKPKSYATYTYGSNGKIQVSTIYTQAGSEKHRYEYDYYENGSRKETRYYKKGKLKDRWLFDCDWKGARETHQTSNTKICKNRSYDNDSNMIEIEEFTTNNKVLRVVSKTARDGSSFEQTVYHANGKMRSKHVYQYNAAHKLIKTSSYGSNGTLTYMELYTYNDQQLLLTSSRIDKTGSTKYRKEFVYN